MRRTNKIISVILALVMILSSMSLTLFASAKVDVSGLVADPSKGIVQGYVTESGNANNNNATVLLDYLDSVLKEVDVSSLESIVNLAKLLSITIDVNSVDGILKTLDSLKGLNDNFITRALIKSVLGYGLVTSNWTKGQSRAKTGDYAILKNLIQFLGDNQEFIGAFAANKTKTVNMETILGDGNDLYNYLKKTVAKLIYNYEKDSSLKSKYDAAVKMSLDDIIFKCALGDGVDSLLKSLDDKIKAKYVNVDEPNKVWAYMYKEVNFKFEGSLKGYTYNQSMTLDATITEIINTIYKNNIYAIKALFTKYGQDLQKMVVDTEWGAPFANVLKLNTTDLSFLDNMSMSKSLKSFNEFAGNFVKGVTTYTGWDDSKNFGYNFEQMFMWAIDEANKSSAENNPYKSDAYKSGDFTTYALALAKIIVNATVEDASVKKTLNACTSTEEVMTKLLPAIVKVDGKKIVGKNSTTYQQVLGDILGYYLNQYAILYTDTDNTTRYKVSSGKTYLEVLNYAANYYLCDLSFDWLLGLDLKKSSSFLSKLDSIQKVIFTGTDKDLEYLKASSMFSEKSGIIKAIMNLDIESLVTVGFEKAFTNINTNVSAANLVYNMLNNVLKGVVGKQVFEGTFKSLDNMISNDSIGKACSNLLVGLNSRKTKILPVAVYIFQALSDKSYVKVTVSSSVSATGKANSGNVKVYNAYTKDALKKDADYKVTAKNTNPTSKATVIVTGTGNYVGSVTKTFKIVPAQVKGLKASSATTTSIKLAWSKTAGASKYEVYRSTDGKKWTKLTTTSSTSYTAKSLSTGKSYQFKVRAVYSSLYGAYSSVLKTTTAPAQVKNLKASSITTTSIKLSWSKATGASKYEVYRSTDGKKWTKLTTTSSTSYTAKSLKAGTKYQFKVRALSSKSVAGSYSSVLKTGTQTKAVTNLKLKSSKSKQVTVSWTKATGATKYIVQYTTDKNFKKNIKSTTVTKNSATLSKLSGGKKIYVKVTAVNAYGVKSSATKAASITVKK